MAHIKDETSIKSKRNQVDFTSPRDTPNMCIVNHIKEAQTRKQTETKQFA